MYNNIIIHVNFFHMALVYSCQDGEKKMTKTKTKKCYYAAIT